MAGYGYHAYIDAWMELVESGKVEACQEQKQLMGLVRHVLDTEDVYIDAGKIDDAVSLIEKYFFPLMPHQKFFMAFVVGVFDCADHTPVFNEFYSMQGRGSGKNGIISAITFYLLSEKHGIKYYDVDIIATSEKQAKTSFQEIYRIIDDSKYLQRGFHYTKEQITYTGTQSCLQYRTSNFKTGDGGRPGALIFDEIHAYENYDNLNVHLGGLGKVDSPRVFYITTDGFVRAAVLDDMKEKARRVLTMEDDHRGFFPFIFKMDSLDEADIPALWEKSIPRINYSVTLKKTVEKEYANAQDNSKQKANFLTKRMNLPFVPLDQTVATWENTLATNQGFDGEALRGRECIGALDYADLRDFCAVGLLFKKDGKRYFKQHTFIHEESIRLTKFNIDIQEAADAGYATIVRGYPTIPASMIAEWFRKQGSVYSIRMIVGDHYRLTAINDELINYGLSVTPVRSGPITHNKIAPLVDKLFAEQRIVFENDKLMRWYCWNVFVKTDDKGNKSYHKIEPEKRKTDGFFAFIHAMSKDEELPDNQEMAVWEPIIF